MLYPLTFSPLFKERIWGGRQLAALYGKQLPPQVPIGESWEISDRPGDESVVTNGPLAGKSLHWLMENHRADLLGAAAPAASGRFPLLIKILDAREKLSLQVHPPAAKATALGGEPKTEMWYIADATPEADLFVGLKPGATRTEFERRLQDGSVAECFSRIPVRAGDAMFLPSGRVHAIGAGNVIFEIQQNSDTTYRVFDWNRVDNVGKPRELHIAQSLASIDFADFAPPLLARTEQAQNGQTIRPLVQDPLFKVEAVTLPAGALLTKAAGTMQIFGLLEGSLLITDGSHTVSLKAGDFVLLPASTAPLKIQATAATTFLRVESGA